MNMIQVLIAGTFCLSAAVSAQAQQEVKTKLATENNITTVPAPGSKRALAKDAKPLPAVALEMAPAVPVAETPSPFTKEKNGTATQDSKPAMTAEQAKILSGTTERPKQAATPTAAPVAQDLKPAATAPARLMIKTQ